MEDYIIKKANAPVSDIEIIGRLIAVIEATLKHPDEINAEWAQENLFIAKQRRGDYDFQEQMLTLGVDGWILVNE